jgi:hypothetical protein
MAMAIDTYLAGLHRDLAEAKNERQPARRIRFLESEIKRVRDRKEAGATHEPLF